MVVVVTPSTVIEIELTTVLADEELLLPPAALPADAEEDDAEEVAADEDEAGVDCDAAVEVSELTELIDMAKLVCGRDRCGLRRLAIGPPLQRG